MTDKAKTILTKTAVTRAQIEAVVKGNLRQAGESTTIGAQIPWGRHMKAIGSGLRKRTPTGPQYAPAESIAEVVARTKVAGVVDRTVEELNSLQWGYRHMRNPYAEANSSSRNTNYMTDYFAKQSSRLRDVDPRNRAVAKARERGALLGSGAGMAAAYILTKNMKIKPLAGALGVVPGFIAGKAVAGTAAKAYQETKRAPKGSHNLRKKAELEKVAIIRKEKDGYHIYGHSGKHLGGPYSEAHAKKRLAQIEYFKKQGAFLSKFPRIRKGIAAAATAGALATPAKAGGLGDLAKALEKEAPKLEATSMSRVHYHKPESAEAARYLKDSGLKGPHWVTSDTTRTTLPTGAERRHIETFYFPQESGDVMREVTKEVVNKKYPDLVDRESWLQKFDYDEARKYLDMKKTLATK